jgi:hypothetical protein
VDDDVSVPEVRLEDLQYLHDQVIHLYCVSIRLPLLEQPSHFVYDVSDGHSIAENPFNGTFGAIDVW